MRFLVWLVERGSLSPSVAFHVVRQRVGAQVPLGRLACREGLMTVDDVNRVLEAQATGKHEPFGEIAMRLRLLDPEGLTRLLDLQASAEPRIEELLLDEGHLGARQLAELRLEFATDPAV